MYQPADGPYTLREIVYSAFVTKAKGRRRHYDFSWATRTPTPTVKRPAAAMAR